MGLGRLKQRLSPTGLFLQVIATTTVLRGDFRLVAGAATARGLARACLHSGQKHEAHPIGLSEAPCKQADSVEERKGAGHHTA